MKDINEMSIKEFSRVIEFLVRKHKTKKGDFVDGLSKTQKNMIERAK